MRKSLCDEARYSHFLHLIRRSNTSCCWLLRFTITTSNPSETMNTLATGDFCYLKGLRSHSAYNGHTVVVVEFDSSHDRYMVQPVDTTSGLPQMLAVKSRNLIPARPSDSSATKNDCHPTGAQFSLHGLPDDSLNGHRVAIVKFLRQEQRYQVAPLVTTSATPQLILVRPENLCPEETVLSPTKSDVESTASSTTASRRPTLQSQTKPSSDSAIQTRGIGMHSCCERLGSLSNVGSVPSSESVSSRSTQSSIIPKGSRARLQGLDVQPSLNGSVVQIHEYISAMRRYRVELDVDDDDEVSQNQRFMVVQPCNLQVLAEWDCDSLPSRASECSPLSPNMSRGSLTTASFPSPHQAHSRRSTITSVSLPRKQPVDKDRRRHSTTVATITNESVALREQLKAGTRVVLGHITGRPDCCGELAVILQYLPTQCAYSVHLLGSKAPEASGFTKELLVSHHQVKPAPVTAFWADMTIKGQPVRVPASCELVADRRQIRVRLDAFAGIDRAVAAGSLLLGPDKCDWKCDREARSTLAQNPTPPLKCVVPPHPDDVALLRDEVLVDVTASSKNAMFRAMVDYELLRPTGSRSTQHSIYKVCFPVPCSSEDKNPFVPPCAAERAGVVDRLDVTVSTVLRSPIKAARSPVCSSVVSPTRMPPIATSSTKNRSAPVDPPADDPSSPPTAIIEKREIPGMTLGAVASMVALEHRRQIKVRKQEQMDLPRSAAKDLPAFKPNRVRWSDTVEELTFLASS